MYMIVNLNVHVEIVHYEGRQGSNMRPRASFFLSQRNYIEAKDFAKYFQIRPPRKICEKLYFVRKICENMFLFAKNGTGHLQIMNLDQPPYNI